MFSMQISRIPRLLTRGDPRPTRAERREIREADEIAAFERTHEGWITSQWLDRARNAPDPDWATRPLTCLDEGCPGARVDVLLGEARLTVIRCVHGACVETAVRPIGEPFACELHKHQPEGN